MGAPRKNANALQHGQRSMLVRFNLGSMPAKLKRIERSVNEFRRVIEAAVVAAHGSIGVYQAALVQSACRHETHSLMVQRWLRLNVDVLSHDQRLSYSKAAADASTARDKCLERLRLDATAGDIADWLYSDDPEPTEPEAEPTNETAADGRTESEGVNHADGPRDEDGA